MDEMKVDAVRGPGGLTVREHMVLQLWGRRWRHAGARERAAQALVGLNGTELAVLVNRLAETPAAVAAYPVMCRRIREARGTRRRTVRSWQE